MKVAAVPAVAAQVLVAAVVRVVPAVTVLVLAVGVVAVLVLPTSVRHGNGTSGGTGGGKCGCLTGHHPLYANGRAVAHGHAVWWMGDLQLTGMARAHCVSEGTCTATRVPLQ